MINVLTIGIEISPKDEGVFKVANKNLHTSNCFGNDFVVADIGESPAVLFGVRDQESALQAKSRWASELRKWLKEGKTIVVLVKPFKEYYVTNNYAWLPLDANWRQIYHVGLSDYAGNIVASNPEIKRFLEKQKYSVRAHIREPLGISFNPLIEVAEGIFSSIEIEIDSGRVLLVPALKDPTAIFELLESLYSGPEGNWKVRQLQSANEILRKAIEKEEKAKEIRIGEEKKVKEVAKRVQKIIDTDLFAKKSMSIYGKIDVSQDPDPRNFYEIIETLERPFGSEHEMRKQLKIPKKKIDRVMKRANDFRHADKEGKEPKPLTNEEIKEFKETTKNIIDTYIQFLFDKSSEDEQSEEDIEEI